MSEKEFKELKVGDKIKRIDWDVDGVVVAVLIDRLIVKLPNNFRYIATRPDMWKKS